MTQLTHTPRTMTAPRQKREADRFWPVLRDLIDAREIFGLKRPVLTTLRALISFLEEGTVIFASNRSIIARAEGISESSLRRHIRALIDSGLMIRHDSTNKKRYRINGDGEPDMTFGLDLAPLERAIESIRLAADGIREKAGLTRYLRKRLGQLIYQARLSGEDDEAIRPYQRALRQKLDPADYEALCLQISNEIAAKMTGRDSQNDCHKNITEERILIREESSSSSEEILIEAEVTQITHHQEIDTTSQISQAHLLRKARELAPDALSMAPQAPETWSEVEALAWQLAAWSGINARLLGQTIGNIGRPFAAMAILILTQNADRVRNPGAYFRALTLGPRQHSFVRGLEVRI